MTRPPLALALRSHWVGGARNHRPQGRRASSPQPTLWHREDSRGIPTASTRVQAASAACQPGLASAGEAPPRLTEVVDHVIDPPWRVRLEEHCVGDHDTRCYSTSVPPPRLVFPSGCK